MSEIICTFDIGLILCNVTPQCNKLCLFRQQNTTIFPHKKSRANCPAGMIFETKTLGRKGIRFMFGWGFFDKFHGLLVFSFQFFLVVEKGLVFG